MQQDIIILFTRVCQPEAEEMFDILLLPYQETCE